MDDIKTKFVKSICTGKSVPIGEEIIHALNRKNQVTDFSKAFDHLDHDSLSGKLDKFRISGDLIALLNSI